MLILRLESISKTIFVCLKKSKYTTLKDYLLSNNIGITNIQDLILNKLLLEFLIY